MWVSLGNERTCGKPATLGFTSEVSGLVPMCDECIAATGTKRANLLPLG
jgi:hypothetical protein